MVMARGRNGSRRPVLPRETSAPKVNHQLTSEFVRQDCGSSRFRLRFRGEGAMVGEVGGGMSNCDLISC